MSSDKVKECVEDALSDLERQGKLHLTDVQRLVDLHGLDGTETAAVFASLRGNGIHLTENKPEKPTDPVELPEVGSASRDTLALMFSAASRARLLTAEEEVLLGRRIRIGQNLRAKYPFPLDGSDEAMQIADGMHAHDQLVLANLRLVVSIARRYRPAGMDLADLIQEGTIGLMRAADKFDHTLGFKFSTYATWWIRQAVQRGIADKGRLIRLPVYVTEKLQRTTSTQNALRASLDREPTTQELATELDADPADIRAILDLAHEPVSLDKPVTADGETTLGSILDLYAPDIAEEVLESLTNASIQAILNDVAEFQTKTAKGANAHAVDMLRLRYGLSDDRERTLAEVGTAYGITRERARQILNKILASQQLRTPLTQFIEND